MVITKEQKDNYIARVHAEMSKRGMSKEEIDRVISKTGFLDAVELCPEEQFHYAISDAVDEILYVAATS
jgi:hypothetical protein